MAAAIALWRQFPRKIRADLQLHYGRRISEWLRPNFTMSSSELLDLLDGLPETSKYKGALRGFRHGVDYEWAPEEYRAAAVARQLAPLDNKDGDLSVSVMLYESYFSPVERAILETQQKVASDRIAKARAKVRRDLYGKAVS